MFRLIPVLHSLALFCFLYLIFDIIRNLRLIVVAMNHGGLTIRVRESSSCWLLVLQSRDTSAWYAVSLDSNPTEDMGWIPDIR
jgi:hypothetical protein